MTRTDRSVMMDARALARALQRMAVEVLELNHGTENLVLIGIQRRGVELAERLGKLIEKDEGVEVPRGAIDITLYRDDLATIGPKPVIGETHLPGDLDELADFGRPRRISLCVLVDRGGRELPIQADIVGKQVKCGPGDRVDVLIEEVDGREEVSLVKGGGPGSGGTS